MRETQQESTDETITSPQAAAILCVDRSTLHYYVKKGKIVPARKLPGKTNGYLFVEAEVRAFALERATAAFDEAGKALAAAKGQAA